MIIFQSRDEYIKEVPTPWYSFLVMPRGWTDLENIYINQDAFFLDERDKQLLINHEQGHIEGKLYGISK